MVERAGETWLSHANAGNAPEAAVQAEGARALAAQLRAEIEGTA
ncbi:hypothetical protein [Streptomyces colonosanans]|nr:hypothetical protein [Streptomyces colonosanans]